MTSNDPEAAEQARRILAAEGKEVTFIETELMEDVEGLPLGVNVTESKGTLVLTPGVRFVWEWMADGGDPHDRDVMRAMYLEGERRDRERQEREDEDA